MGAEDFSDYRKILDNIRDCNISSEDQLKLLDEIKEHSSFSEEDFGVIQYVIAYRYVDKRVKFKALEILLNDNVENIPVVICKLIEKYILGEYESINDDWFLPLKAIIKIEPQESLHQHYIFAPFWVRSNVDKDLLRDYEKYLVKNLKYFTRSFRIGYPLYQTIEKMFAETEDSELKSEYIDAMFYLDMWETLLKIISDTSLDVKYRKQAVSVSLKLLPYSDSFKEFSENFFYALKDISNNPEEEKSLKNLTDHIITSLAQGKMSLKDNDNARNIQGLLESGVFDD